MIDRGKSKILGVKPVENISKNLQSFLNISLVEKEVLSSHKLWEHAYDSCYGWKWPFLAKKHHHKIEKHSWLSQNIWYFDETKSFGNIFHQKPEQKQKQNKMGLVFAPN